METSPTVKNSSTSLQTVILNLSNFREQIIRQLLVRESLMSYLEERYAVFAISAVKEEFLRRDLVLLADARLDLVRYSTPIQELKANPTVQIGPCHEDYVHAEIADTIRKYCS